MTTFSSPPSKSLHKVRRECQGEPALAEQTRKEPPDATYSRLFRLAVLGSAATVLLTGCLGSSDSGGEQDTGRNADAKKVELAIGANAVKGGKNTAGAEFTETVLIPKFVEAQKAKGVEVTVKFQGDGSEDEIYKQKLALGLSNKTGPDLINVDGIWVGEFAQAGYIKPLTDTVGDAAKVDDWDGWKQIPDVGPAARHVRRQAVRRTGWHRRPGAVLQQETVRPGRTAGRLAARSRGTRSSRPARR